MSIELARIFAIYFLVVGVSLMVNKEFFLAATKEIASSNIGMLIVATVTLMLGAILVNLHNIWVNDWRVAITILCWVVMFSGLVRMLFPTVVQRMAVRLQGNFVPIASVVCLVLGVLYAYLGFF
ncbi:MAG: hypothetical protein M3R00_00855 [Pseudomonadota bacterium]|nr:hypothetical protein [Pseudomonadota bacterium]